MGCVRWPIFLRPWRPSRYRVAAQSEKNMALVFVSRIMKLAAILAVGILPYYAVASPVAPAKSSNYVIDERVVIHADDGATLCALVVRPAGAQPRPTALEFTIYVDPKKDLGRLE